MKKAILAVLVLFTVSVIAYVIYLDVLLYRLAAAEERLSEAIAGLDTAVKQRGDALERLREVYDPKVIHQTPDAEVQTFLSTDLK